MLFKSRCSDFQFRWFKSYTYQSRRPIIFFKWPNFSFNSNPNIPIGEEEKNVKSPFRDEFHALPLCHISNTMKAFATEFLEIFWEEWYKELPKIAATLLKSNKYAKKDIMKFLVNIDGLPIFNRASQQFWTISCLVFDPDYESAAFIVAVFCWRTFYCGNFWLCLRHSCSIIPKVL